MNAAYNQTYYATQINCYCLLTAEAHLTLRISKNKHLYFSKTMKQSTAQFPEPSLNTVSKNLILTTTH
jgi:hypothetical protein